MSKARQADHLSFKFGRLSWALSFVEGARMGRKALWPFFGQLCSSGENVAYRHHILIVFKFVIGILDSTP